VSRYDQPALTANVEARNDAHVGSTGLRLH